MGLTNTGLTITKWMQNMPSKHCIIGHVNIALQTFETVAKSCYYAFPPHDYSRYETDLSKLTCNNRTVIGNDKIYLKCYITYMYWKL